LNTLKGYVIRKLEEAMHRINSKWWHELWPNFYCHDDVTLSLTEYVQLREVQMNQFLVC